MGRVYTWLLRVNMSVNKDSLLVGAPLQDPDPGHKISTPVAERKEGQHDEKPSPPTRNKNILCSESVPPSVASSDGVCHSANVGSIWCSFPY